MQPVKQHTGNINVLPRGAFWGILLGPSWVVLGASRAVLGPSWASWNALGPSWRPIRPSGALLGAFLARLVDLGPHGGIAVHDPETLRERPRDLTIWAACPYKRITIMISAHRFFGALRALHFVPRGTVGIMGARVSATAGLRQANSARAVTHAPARGASKLRVGRPR